MTQPLKNSFKICPQCGVTPETPGESPFRCASCDFCFYFSPTAAVGAIITNADQELLFLIRSKDPGKGKLGLPGGFVDAGESLEESLYREVLEETSLKVCTSKYLCSFPNQYDYRGFTIPVADTFFVCQVETFEGLQEQAGEVDGFEIAQPDIDLIARMAFKSNQKAIKFYLSGLH